MLIVARPQIQEETITPTRSKFSIEPLQPGFGYTLGNALRRTLLSSIPGAAISSVRIEGVLHEFSTIPKVTEDVTDIILNLKQVVLRSEVDEPVTAYLKARGPADVTSGDIQPPAGVEILNPEQHLATLGRGASLELWRSRGTANPTLSCLTLSSRVPMGWIWSASCAAFAPAPRSSWSPVTLSATIS